ncbi:hypothetical protein ACFRMQ_28095 [Kitasatospora sp. NPDC056783]|uniref:hypothetical protein n=1 Tax=Kitasatospora sp. NPDC056783 TaxID=3345943 RepID=UPI0036B83D67
MTGAEAAGLGAFVESRQGPYRRYAVARLGRTPAAGEAVDQAVEALAACWPRLVCERSPAAGAWVLLREAVSLRGRETCDQGEVDVLHRLLPVAVADAAVLHYRLGMRLTEAADLMGVEPSAAAGLVLAAERGLPRALVGELAFGPTRV